MKITSQKYAQSVYELTEGKNREEVALILQRFINVLVNNRDLSKIDSVLGNFIKIYNENTDRLEVELISKFELSDDTVANIKEYISKKTNFGNISIRQIISDDILGSVVIKYEDKVLDISLNNILQQLKQKMIE